MDSIPWDIVGAVMLLLVGVGWFLYYIFTMDSQE
ncbi:hypothetical protein PMIT1313_02325 [Prochlorococcus marinus str. MIT 1313]|nr:hypothetical protein PMIT1313_02325 [Prochlorococcus marinus str. MIT 1313]